MIAIYLATKQVCNALLPQVTMKALQALAVLVSLLTLSLCHTIQTEYFVRDLFPLCGEKTMVWEGHYPEIP